MCLDFPLMKSRRVKEIEALSGANTPYILNLTHLTFDYLEFMLHWALGVVFGKCCSFCLCISPPFEKSKVRTMRLTVTRVMRAVWHRSK